MIERIRRALGGQRRAENLEIRGGILLVPEDRRRHSSGRIVDRPDEGEPRSPTSSQSWRLPSSWRRRPSAGIRSRRLRCFGGRRRRGLATSAPRRIRWRLGRLITIPSRSASSSVKGVSLTPVYVVRRSSTTRPRSTASRRRVDGRPGCRGRARPDHRARARSAAATPDAPRDRRGRPPRSSSALPSGPGSEPRLVPALARPSSSSSP